MRHEQCWSPSGKSFGQLAKVAAKAAKEWLMRETRESLDRGQRETGVPPRGPSMGQKMAGLGTR